MSEDRPKVLVVDDISDWRKTLLGLLTDEGYEVTTAASAAEAMQRVEKMTFDLALVDIRLDDSEEGNTDGLDLIKAIKKSRRAAKIAALTGYADLPMVIAAIEEAGADDFIEKSDYESFIERIRDVMKYKRQIE